MHAPGIADADVRIDPQFMFSDHKSIHKPRLEKAQRKFLKKIPFINAFLAADEKVLLIVPCVSPTSIWEQLTTGWIFMHLNRALLVVTNKGFIHVPTKGNYDYRQSIAKFRFEDCKQLRIRGSHLYVQYGNGRKETFLYLQRVHRKKLKPYLENLNISANAANGGRVHLCPRCTVQMPSNNYFCPACRLAFKDMATANRLSLLIPGGGYFYTGHPFLGLGDFLVELWLLLTIMVLTITVAQGDPSAVAGLVFFVILLVLEKLITIHHAKRYISEYIPKDKVVRLEPASR